MLTILLSVLVGLFAIASSVLGFLLASSTKRHKKFANIIDLEKHAQAIKSEGEVKASELEKINAEIGKQKQVFQKYVDVVGVVKTAAEAQQKLNTIKTELTESSKLLGVAQSALEFSQKLIQERN
jgi:hypothetical protein